MKVGIYGGTFNPVHNGHIAVAEAALKNLNLDCVFFVVANDPPHKYDPNRIPGSVRLEMLCTGIVNEKSFYASDIELSRGGLSYTVDTLAEINSMYDDAELYFIVGADMLENFQSWHKPEEILKYASLAAVGRLANNCDIKKQHDELAYIASQIEWRFGGRVLIVDAYGPDISSTNIREAVKNAESISEYVPLEVEKYIYTHMLYFDDRCASIGESLKAKLDEKRFGHTMLVAREAIMLAQRYGADTRKARLAGLLHDCMKIDVTELIQYANANDIELSETELNYPYTIHGKVGAECARKEYEVNDDEILNAIRNHTIGSIKMTLLDKIIFLADKLELSRNYDDVEELRMLAYSDMNAALVAVMKHTIEHTKHNGREVHPDTQRILDALEREAYVNLM